MVCDVTTAIKISAGNETYKKLVVLVSNDPAFGAGNCFMAGEIEVGKGVSLDGLDMADSVIGRYEIMFSNNLAGSIYEYAAALSGDRRHAARRSSLSAFMSKLPMI